VDPGKKGGIAYQVGQKWFVYPMPPYEGLRRFWSELSPRVGEGARVFVEKPETYPHDGRMSVLTTGYGWGRLEEAIFSAGLWLEHVTVRAWQEHHGVWGMGLKGRAKKAAHVALVNRKWGLGLRDTQDGLADAVLIAAYVTELG